MLATIAKTWRFEAAHHLPNHDGKCRRPHGHSYEVTVAVTGEVKRPNGDPDEGMVVDFGRLTELWRRELEPALDHQDLNVTLASASVPTTAENIAGLIGEAFRHAGFAVAYVELRETATGMVRVDFPAAR